MRWAFWSSGRCPIATGRKAILVPGMAALAIATAALAAASSLPMMALLRSVQGLLAASFAAAALAYVGEALPPRLRSVGIGAISTAFLVVGIVGQVYAQAVALGVRAGRTRVRLGYGRSGHGSGRTCPPRPARELGRKYRELGALAVRRELALSYTACCTVLLSFVAMFALTWLTVGPAAGAHACGLRLSRCRWLDLRTN
jgi:MFS family permease